VSAVTEELAFFNKDEKTDSSELPSLEILKAIRKTLKDSSLYQHSYSSIDKKSSGIELLSADGTLQNRSGDEPDEETSMEVAEDQDYPRGNLFGEALHQVFEELDFVRIGNMTLKDAQEDSELHELITTKFLSQGLPIGKHPNWMTRTIEIVWNTMNASFQEIHGTEKTGKVFNLKELESSQRLAEMEFRLKANDGGDEILKTFTKGFMDLVFVRKDGDKEYYSVLDWKSNLLKQIRLRQSPSRQHSASAKSFRTICS
jgi:exodeoxyribonuclease V beta subunit